MSNQTNDDKGHGTMFDELMRKRFFYVPSYEIYGGVKGLYDYGPPGSAILANVVHFWRQFFIVEENMLEISTTSLAPEQVFQVSGHCEKFLDYSVRDLGEPKNVYRADHLLKDKLKELMKKEGITEEERKKYEDDLARLDDFGQEDLGLKLKEYGVKSPDTGNDISDPFPFHLMFDTQIGPTGKLKGYLRPETAQGMFVNFPRLLEYNNGRLPFAAAQVGPAYRNEISPRSGLLRVREFTLAEIEHFVNPKDKSHHKFFMVKDYVLPLYPRDVQLSENKDILHMTIGEAVEKGIVNNETLGYFLVRCHQFLLSVGIKKDKIRFRQHLEKEMAHYASDCWDGEIFCSYGWIECVGNADRACYDLNVHARASGKTMSAFINFPEGPREEEIIELVVNKRALGSVFKKKAQPVLEYFERIKDDEDEIRCLEDNFKNSDKQMIEGLEITKEMIQFNKYKKVVVGKKVRPSVIEPSYGIGRIIYCLLEQSFALREGGEEQRQYLTLKPHISPIQCSVFPLLSKEQFITPVEKIASTLRKAGITSQTDISGVSIGRKYSRVDEIGCPFCITVDHKSLEDNTVTLRERNSTQQIRLPIDDLVSVLSKLCSINEDFLWEDITKIYPSENVNSE